jgi:hypothetical protein
MTVAVEKPESAFFEDVAPLPMRKELERRFAECGLVRPFRRAAHDPGDRLEYAITGVAPANTGRMTVEVERFVGGGFAGQVYRVRLLEVVADEEPIAGLTVGGHYAMKILRPPSGFAGAFRDFLYFLAYQGPFNAQVSPAGVRVGVLWQKLIHRAAAMRFGRESAVCDTYATLYDADLHSFGEINEWIDGRIWKFEVDDNLFGRWKFDGPPSDGHPSAEYVHKRLFMRELVALLHDMGAPELARQYEWWTCKSQPNALKRFDEDHSPGAGLTAVDFRAGLALLPFLPMSPGDVRLILTGLRHGRIVQFDRSDPARFRRFVESHRADFVDLQPAIRELEEKEPIHREALPDLTHRPLQLITDSSRRRAIKEGRITAWRNLGRIDEEHARRLREGRAMFPLLFLVSLVPLLGRRIVKLWGDAAAREHARRCLTSGRYLWRAMRGSRIETLIVWHRRGRVGDERALRLVDRPVRYWAQRLTLGLLPARWHRFLADYAYARQRVRESIGFVVQFLRVPEFREEWLLEQVRRGRSEGMLTEAEAQTISRQVGDPYIQKYLLCLAAHLCTLPITKVCVILVGVAVTAYCLTYKGMGWAASVGYGMPLGLLVASLPISPGSIARGVFVLYMMIRDRDIRNYWIAAPVSFLHVIGYLAFPLQMVAHDPTLARFLAGRWARDFVHVVPVFGEGGGLLEHAVFDLLFNLPLTVKRGFKTRPVRWSVGTLLAAVVMSVAVYVGFGLTWQWAQPGVRLDGAQVISIFPNHVAGGRDASLARFDRRVRFSGHGGDVQYPARRWDDSVRSGDTVDAVIRRSFFHHGYDGLSVSRR